MLNAAYLELRVRKKTPVKMAVFSINTDFILTTFTAHQNIFYQKVIIRIAIKAKFMMNVNLCIIFVLEN